jgi:hypothetical protein
MLQNRKEQESIEKMISFLCSRNLFHEVFNQRSFKRMTEEKDSQKEEKEERESVLHEWKEEKLLVMNGRKEEKLLVMNGGKEENLLVINGRKRICWS